MFNDLSLPDSLTTEQIQKYLKENNELILASLEYQNLGKIIESAQCQAKLQHNLTYLTKVADIGSQVPSPSQVSSHATMQRGQGMQQPHLAMSQPQPNLSTLNLPLEINDQQHHQQQHQAMSLHQSTSKLPLQINDRQQQHLEMSLHQPNISTSKMPLHMNNQQQQHWAMFLHQHDNSRSNMSLPMNDQQQHLAMPLHQPDISTLKRSLQHHQQQHVAMSLHQPDISTSNLSLQISEQNYKFPFFLYPQQLIPRPIGSFPVITNNGINQTSQTRLSNQSDTPSSNQTGSDSGHGW